MTRLYKWFDRNLKGRALYVFLIAAAIAVAYFIFFDNVLAEIDRQKLAEKEVGIEVQVSILADSIQYMVAKDKDWDEYDYDSLVSASIVTIDEQYQTFGAAYRGLDFELISDRTYETEPFEPFDYPEFSAMAEASFGSYEQHRLTVWWDAEDPETPDCYMHMTLQWVPVLDDVSDPYLIVVAINKFSVQTQTAQWLQVGIICFGVFVVLVTYILLGYIVWIVGRRKESANEIRRTAAADGD